MFVTGPDVIKTVTHEEVSKQELGGAMTHNATSCVAHFISRDDADCCAMLRELFSFLPSNNMEDPPRRVLHDLQVEPHGDVGVTRGTIEFIYTDGRPTLYLVYVRIYRKLDGDWRAISHRSYYAMQR